jgi:hypothetical protein
MTAEKEKELWAGSTVKVVEHYLASASPEFNT